ncbi:putative Blue copper protein precursor [Tripterygium wilfordii]|nr:putative Blue copper protein precursor [Tripterygium wilfordii]
MASSQLFIAISTVALIFLPSVLATDFFVGDGNGWRINFDYQAWAAGKEFRVGDKLVFKYPEGAHNVHKVDVAGFQNCAAPAGSQALVSGNDVITLSSPGKKWYICGVGKHCEVGNQKLVITVLPQVGTPASSPSPSPAPASAAAAGRTITSASLKFYGWMLSILGIFFF